MIQLAALLLIASQDSDADKITKDRASLLRTAQKPLATFVGAERGQVRLVPDKETAEKAWAVDPEAEVRVQGWWGRLEDLAPGERVWAWVRLDRAGKPRAVFMIADELSEQDIHQVPYTLASLDVEKGEVALKRTLDRKNEQTRTLRLRAAADGLKPGDTVYVQTAGEEVRRIVNAEGLTALKEAQKARVEERLRKDGLPGTVTALHALIGEVEISFDHEGMRWARALKGGEIVRVNLESPIKAAVTEVRPWNERTRVSLVAVGRELADLSVGQRVKVAVPEPAADILRSKIPPDAGRPRDPAARAEWFLASTYCSCSIAGDGCTGMFYTLAACNSMKCGMPNRVRGFVRPLIQKGLPDSEILERMEEEYGPAIWKPHLLK